MASKEIDPRPHKYWLSRESLKKNEKKKNLQVTLLLVDFTKAFDSIHRGKMEQILLAYGLPKETAITILYNTTKVKVPSPQALASMSMHTKWNICAIIKQATSPH